MKPLLHSTATAPTPSSATNCCVGFYQLEITQFLLGDSFHPGGIQLTSQLAQKLLLNRESRVLDIASGRGTSSLFLAEHFGCELVTLDLSTNNLLLTQLRAKQKHLSEHITPVQSEASQLPFDDHVFDAIICECALCTFTKPEQVLNEMWRVLKPDGKLGLSDIILKQTLPAELNGQLAQIFCISGAKKESEYLTLLKQSGFKKNHSKRVDWAIKQMVEQIEKQLKILELMPTHSNQPAIPDWLKGKNSLFNAMKTFIKQGGLGYSLITAIK